MSKLKVTTISDPDNDNTALTIDSSGNVTASQGFVPSTQLSHRNLIINGAMQVAQRGTSFTGITTSGYYIVDRWNMILSSLGTWTQSQETDAPDGYKNSLKIVPTTANASPTAGAYCQLETRLEAQDLERLNYGNSNAKSITFSFWVKSNKTGTYNLRLYRIVDSTRLASKQYTVNASGVWEHKTITFDGDTAIGLTGGNSLGLSISWWLGAGTTFTSGSSQDWGSYLSANEAPSQVNVADSTSNYFQITGVQLEVGSVATPFEHRSYGEELARCQRYYQSFNDSTTWIINMPEIGSSYYRNTIWFQNSMRTAPSVTWSSTGSLGATYGTQFISVNSFTPYVNTGSGAIDINGWTADAEL